jgi:hypothetical protein
MPISNLYEFQVMLLHPYAMTRECIARSLRQFGCKVDTGIAYVIMTHKMCESFLCFSSICLIPLHDDFVIAHHTYVIYHIASSFMDAISLLKSKPCDLALLNSTVRESSRLLLRHDDVTHIGF